MNINDIISDGTLEYTLRQNNYGLNAFINGEITTTNSRIQRTIDNSSIIIMGGSNYSSAHASFNGFNRDSEAGVFKITASDGINTKKLIGTPSGNLTWDNKNILNSSNIKVSSQILLHTLDDNFITVCGGTTTTTSSYLQTYGKDHTYHPGHFQLVAKNATQHQDLIGTPQGELTWGGYDLGGAAIVKKSIAAEGYIQYASGLTFQWGIKLVESGVTNTYLAFPISFINECVTCIGSEATDDIPNQNGILVWNYSKNGCQLITQKPNVYVHWFAIGY